MQKKTKRAFTITELVVVIAVVAILAAVLIPTFANVTKSARESADEQAAASMNRVLASETVLTKPSTPAEVRRILLSGGIQSYTPYESGTYFGWLPDENVIVIYEVVDGATNVLYPEDYKGTQATVWNLEVDTVTTAADLVQVVSNAEEGSTVQIAQDLTLGEGEEWQSLSFKNGISFDLNGHTLSMGSKAMFQFQVLEGDSTVNEQQIIIENGTIIDTAAAGEFNRASFGLMDLYYEQESDRPLSILIKDITIKANAGNKAITSTNSKNVDFVFENTNVTGLSLFNDVNSVTVNSGTFTGNAGDGAVVYANRPLTINGGTFTATGDQYVIYTADASPSQGLIINGGTFVGGKEDDDADGAAEVIGHITTPVLIHINGGVFNGEQYLGAQVNDSYTGNIEAICREERVVFS